MSDAMGNCVVCGSKVNTSNGKCDACDGGVASLRTQLDQERQRREQAEELLQDAESEVWVTCACEPKKPDWWGGGDQWELRPYRDRASERVRRCAFHAEYDKYFGEK